MIDFADLNYSRLGCTDFVSQNDLPVKNRYRSYFFVTLSGVNR